jgi:hypothetical protein
MKERLVLAWCAVCVLVVSSTAFAQRLPQDDPNPAWKGELSSKPTPRGEDGRPELVGMWQRSGAGFTAEHGRFVEFRRGRDASGGGADVWRGRGDGAISFINFERDSGIALRAATNKPQYKPEHWERVQYMDKYGNQEDPEMVCYPSGVPRMGPPNRIVQTSPKEFIFFYQRRNAVRVIPIDQPERPYEEWEGISWLGHASAQWDGDTLVVETVDLYQRRNAVRMIPVDQPERPYDEWEGISWLGHPSARWEGDTLVVETVDFGDHSWLEFPGYIHSNEMRVTERFTRTGDVLKWEVTVDDHEMFLEPWVWNPWYLRSATTAGWSSPGTSTAMRCG